MLAPRQSVLGTVARYVAAVVIAVFAIGFASEFQAYSGGKYVFITFFPSVILAGLIGGLWPGVVVLGSTAVAALYVMPPVTTLSIGSVADQVAFGLYVSTSLFTLLVVSALRRSAARARVAHREANTLASRLRLALAVAPVHLYTTDLRLRYTAIANPLKGYRESELLGKTDEDIVPREVCGELMDFKRSVLATRTPARRDIILRLPERTLYYDVSAEPIFDERGEPAGLAVAALDVTARHVAMEEVARLNRTLQRQVMDFESLLHVIPVGIGIASDPECRHIRVNPAFAAMLGLPVNANASLSAPEGERPGHFSVFKGNERVPPEKLPLQIAAREGVHVNELQLDIVHDDGRRLRLLQYASPLLDEQGRPRGAVGAFVDLSARLAADERFRLLADNAPVLVWLADDTGAGTWFNRPWVDFVGRPVEALTGQAWVEDIHPDDRDRAVGLCAAASAARQTFSMEFRLRRHDGEYRWVLDRGRPLYEGDGGTFSGYIGSCVDITEIKELESERTRLLEAERAARHDAEQSSLEAQRASRMKDEFLATLSHELRTPLNAMLGWIDILTGSAEASGTGVPDPSDFAEGLAAIERNARAQAQLIEDLLDMSRIISGRIRLDRRRADLSGVVDAAVTSVLPQMAQRSLNLTRAIEPGVFAEIDTDRVEQILLNLLSNAIKFTPPGGSVHVSLEARGLEGTEVEATDASRPAEAVLQISDTGQGIAPSFLPFVFDRFRQGDATTTRRHGGLGLGLALVRQLTELHGGRVEARSEGVGRGATFVVHLPLGCPATASVATVAGPGGSAGAEISGESSSEGGVAGRSHAGGALGGSRTAAEQVWSTGTLGNGATSAAGGSTPGLAAAGLAMSGLSVAEGVGGLRARLASAALLVVEDDADTRAIVRRLLMEAGAALVDVAPDADRALELLGGRPYQVLVSDIGMPGRDGHDLLRTLRSTPNNPNRHVPALALTAFAREEDRQQALAAGFDAYLAKPLDRARLLATVNDLLSSANSSPSASPAGPRLADREPGPASGEPSTPGPSELTLATR